MILDKLVNILLELTGMDLFQKQIVIKAWKKLDRIQPRFDFRGYKILHDIFVKLIF